MSLSAEDLRNVFRIGFQPSLTANPVVLAGVLDHMARQLLEEGVTERRIRNAAAAIDLEDVYVEALLAQMFPAAFFDDIAVECDCMVETDPLGGPDRVLTHSLTCSLHPDHDDDDAPVADGTEVFTSRQQADGSIVAVTEDWSTPVSERACTVEMAHPSCTLCERAAADARSLARAVGSRSVTCTDERVGLTHSATVTWGRDHGPEDDDDTGPDPVWHRYQ